MRYLLGLVPVVAVLAFSPHASARDLDCSDFSNQAEAQKHLTPGDPHRLDADGDGMACDSLPCPCASGNVGGSGKPKRLKGLTFQAWGVDVVDGDTIDVRRVGSRKMYRVRLLGIDTPEVHGGKECGGEAASRRMGLMAQGFVRVRTDPSHPKRDRYNRLLAYVSKGRKDLNKRMVSLGLARVYVVGKRFSSFRSYKRAQVRARSAGRGSWGRCGRI